MNFFWPDISLQNIGMILRNVPLAHTKFHAEIIWSNMSPLTMHLSCSMCMSHVKILYELIWENLQNSMFNSENAKSAYRHNSWMLTQCSIEIIFYIKRKNKKKTNKYLLQHKSNNSTSVYSFENLCVTCKLLISNTLKDIDALLQTPFWGGEGGEV